MNSIASWLLGLMGIVRRRTRPKPDGDMAEPGAFEQFLEEMRMRNLRNSGDRAERARQTDRDAA